jgi:hypothetical protein
MGIALITMTMDRHSYLFPQFEEEAVAKLSERLVAERS